MGLLAAYAVPHPPLILPDVGRGEQRAIQDTVDAYERVARRIVAHHPETIVLTSPHAPLFRDCFYVAVGGYVDDMRRFRAPGCAVDLPGDDELAAAIAERAQAAEVPVLHRAVRDDVADHASLIPLWFACRVGLDPACRVVRMGLSGLDFEAHRNLGACISDAVSACGRRAVLVASGDLSHKLMEDGPYGFAAEGPRFDKLVTCIFAEGRLEGLFGIDAAFAEAAAECGLRSFQIMAGALGREEERTGTAFGSELLSYEGPFGVGYAVAAFEGKTTSAATSNAAASGNAAAPGDAAAPEATELLEASEPPEAVDPLVALARESVEGFVCTGRPIGRPDWLPRRFLEERAGVFVSLRKGDELRGCIGTIAPTCACVADEVVRNGIAAASEDPRFSPVCADELDFLSYSVDVLAPPEPVSSPDELDPARFGVIVTQGWRRGLLLPNLEGVDAVEQQISIAKRKAGIWSGDGELQLERFEVVRHVAGGQARRG